MIDPTNPNYANTPVSALRPVFDYIPSDKSAPPAVTILTAIYNTGAVFLETVRSVFSQSFQQWEWIIVNDGSTNLETLAMLEQVASTDPRIRLIHLESNKGPGAARNIGFREAATPYVALLDSDDLLEPTAIEKWYWFLESHPEYAFVKGFTVGFGDSEFLKETSFEAKKAFLERNQLTTTSMVRRAVHEEVGGYEESGWEGLEDWEFWLRCANAGYWGGNIPEYLDWYRMPATNYGGNLKEDRLPIFQAKLKERYPCLWEQGFPEIKLPSHPLYTPLSELISCQNLLQKKKPRLLMLLNRPDLGGASKFNIDILKEFTKKDWEVTAVCTPRGTDNPLLPSFAKYTPDIFLLQNHLRLPDYLRFLRYLIESRQIDAIFISCSLIGYYLLPLLRSYYPDLPIVDYCHIEYEPWSINGFPDLSIQYKGFLDLQIVSSNHLKKWMVAKGVEENRVQTCYTNIDPDEWKPNNEIRIKVRQELGIATDTPLILYAARLVDQKQPQVFAKTVLELSKAGVIFKVLVAGNGPYYNWLEESISHNCLNETITLLGAVNSGRVKELLCAADIYFLPSKIEGISLAIFEAMSMGVVPVSSDVGGQRELVTKECGTLISPATEEEEAKHYSEEIVRLIKAPDTLQKMKISSRERIITHFQLNLMTQRLEALILEAKNLNSEQSRQPPAPDLVLRFASQEILREYEWIHIEQGNIWLNNQYKNWMEIAEKRQEVIEELRQQLHDAHEQAEQWQISQRIEVEKLSKWAKDLDAFATNLHAKRLFRILQKVRLLPKRS
ncbi:glycosyltransferase [Candidatus Chlorohelix sp.]|uniref:glycosyltransferase n=1 Tax=Candidatus Chlorohelix sp. TaxID=3139201 RepID=UPI0030377C34